MDLRRIDIILYTLAGLLLLVPYSITMLSKKLEPYPAIILPDGSSTVMYNTKYITYSKIELIGTDAKTGTPRAINIDSFFSPIPSNRIYGFVNNSFGIDAIRRDTLRFRRNIFEPILGAKNYDEKESNHLNAWYQSKLVAQGLEDSNFSFQEEIIKIDRNTSEIVDSTLLRSENYSLYD